MARVRAERPDDPGDRRVIELTVPVSRTPRVQQLEGLFDLQPVTESRVELRELSIGDLPDDWSVGLIVGPSGSGKTTIARHAFGPLAMDDSADWPRDRAVIDAFPHMPITEITDLLSSVGFSSPPAWRRPFHVLSNGEQFRVKMARRIADARHHSPIVVDEFTSVVDRTVARIASAAIARTVRNRGLRFVACSCHFDIEEWLQPDWVYQPDTGELVGRSVQPRPPIALDVIRATGAAWPAFAPHHYLSADMNRSAITVVGMIDGQPAVLCALLALPHARYRSAFRVHRIVVKPDYQGVGLGTSMLRLVGGAMVHRGSQLSITSSHPAIVRSLARSPLWARTRRPSRQTSDNGSKSSDRSLTASRATGRLVSSFRFAGPADPQLAPLFEVTNRPAKKSAQHS